MTDKSRWRQLTERTQLPVAAVKLGTSAVPAWDLGKSVLVTAELVPQVSTFAAAVGMFVTVPSPITLSIVVGASVPLALHTASVIKKVKENSRKLQEAWHVERNVRRHGGEIQNKAEAQTSLGRLAALGLMANKTPAELQAVQQAVDAYQTLQGPPQDPLGRAVYLQLANFRGTGHGDAVEEFIREVQPASARSAPVRGFRSTVPVVPYGSGARTPSRPLGVSVPGLRDSITGLISGIRSIRTELEQRGAGIQNSSDKVHAELDGYRRSGELAEAYGHAITAVIAATKTLDDAARSLEDYVTKTLSM
jgi:hypothetical protein